MSDTVDLTQGKWRLHTRLGVVGYWSEEAMGAPAPSGTGNSDVLFTFEPAPADLADIAAQLAPVAPSVLKPPSGLKATWYRAHFPEPPPEGEPLDTEVARGEHWARVFQAAQKTKDSNPHPFVQVVQMNWNGLEDSLRIFIGRLVHDEPGKMHFFGHGTGNDGVQNHSFTLRQVQE